MSYVIDKVSDSGAMLVSLDEAKVALKVTHKKEDAYITNLIERVTSDMEGFTWRSFEASQYKVHVSSWMGGCIPLEIGPVSAIDSVQYYDETNTLQTWASSNYFFARGVPDRLMKEFNVTVPITFNRPDAVVVTYSTAPVLPEKVKARILLAVGYMFEHRSSLDMSMNEVYAAVTSGIRSRHF